MELTAPGSHELNSVALEGITKGIVTQINVPEEEIAPFKDMVKTIIGKAQIKEEVTAE